MRVRRNNAKAKLSQGGALIETCQGGGEAFVSEERLYVTGSKRKKKVDGSMCHRQIVADRYRDKFVKQNTTDESDWIEGKPQGNWRDSNSMGMGTELKAKKPGPSNVARVLPE